MTKKIMLGMGIVGILGIILIAGDFFQKNSKETVWFDESDYERVQIVIAQEVFSALVADTDTLRQKGLSGHPGLKRNQAMFFIFPESKSAGFWMKDMLFSIDILWLDENGSIVSFAKNVSPDTYPHIFVPKAPARYVIELTAGTLDRLGVREGDSIILP